ncbi:hypothetical protein BS17DRAFT_823392 [Gyrodon lividus]|nr:hypothetical protein BS17DRAFT_823392 [Gyrodon lividus]
MQQENLTPTEQQEVAKAFLKFVLTGCTLLHNRNHHITINACQDVIEPEVYHITRDYDSLIGISKNLPYSVHLALTSVPPFRDTLTQSSHMKGPAYVGDVPHLAALHTIPNFAFAKKLGHLRPEFRDAYFVHELQGWKGATVHDPDNIPNKVAALGDLTHVLDMDHMVQEDWQIVVTLELGLPGHVIAWKTNLWP